MRTPSLITLALVACALLAAQALGVERFPPPDFEGGYTQPAFHQERRGDTGGTLAVGVMVAALAVGAYAVLVLRRRPVVIGLSLLVGLVFFGFIREGCVCPIGASQNVSLALFDGSYHVPWHVLALFLLPLAAALLFGRIFCAGVCPLGAIQDVVLIRPVRVPRGLEAALGVIPFLYLGTAILLAVTGGEFLICRYDPFVGFFRLGGPRFMLVFGGLLLVVAAFVGRPYCRFLCPYGVLLGACSRFAWKRPSITPDECVTCGLCENACPFGAIQPPTPEGAAEE